MSILGRTNYTKFQIDIDGICDRIDIARIYHSLTQSELVLGYSVKKVVFPPSNNLSRIFLTIHTKQFYSLTVGNKTAAFTAIPKEFSE